MAKGMNKTILIGNVGRDPELRQTKAGHSVLGFSMATNERFKNRDGEWQDRTEWHKVVVWGNRAEGLGKIVEKGTQLCVEGRLQTRQWEDKTGQKRFTTEIVAQEVVLLGGRSGGGSGDGGGGSRYPSGAGTTPFSDDDIPF